MRISPLAAALVLIGCGSNASMPSSTSSSPATSAAATDEAPVGSATEALRQLNENDNDAVQSCDDLVQRCNAHFSDSGAASGICDKLAQHCSELDAELSAVRAAIQSCLEKAAACEQSKGADAGSCEAAHQACAPADKDFQAKRGQALQCSQSTQACLVPQMGPFHFGRPGDADAGPGQCDANATDFMGCCHGHDNHFGNDAGVFGGAFGGGRMGLPVPPAAGRMGAGMNGMFGGGAFGGGEHHADADAGVSEGHDRAGQPARPPEPPQAPRRR
jgi:hypothetical protein